MSDNPIRTVLARAAAGRSSTRADVDSLPLAADAAPRVRAEITRSLDLVRALRAVGLYVEAHRYAAVTAADLRRFVEQDEP